MKSMCAAILLCQHHVEHGARACGSRVLRMRQVCDDPLEMYQGDLMTVNLNLAGVASSAVPQMCPCRHLDVIHLCAALPAASLPARCAWPCMWHLGQCKFCLRSQVSGSGGTHTKDSVVLALRVVNATPFHWESARYYVRRWYLLTPENAYGRAASYHGALRL